MQLLSNVTDALQRDCEILRMTKTIYRSQGHTATKARRSIYSSSVTAPLPIS